MLFAQVTMKWLNFSWNSVWISTAQTRMDGMKMLSLPLNFNLWLSYIAVDDME